MTTNQSVEPDRQGNRPDGHEQFTVADMANENAKFFDSRADADDGLEKAKGAPGVDPELFPPGESPEFLYHGDRPESDDTSSPVACGICGEPVENPADATADVTGTPVHTACWEDADVEPADPDDSSAAVVDDAPDTDHEPEVLSADEVEAAADKLPDERNVDQDPLKWMPGEFVDTIDGSAAINRKGFEVLSHFYGVDVSADLEVAPEDTDHEYARVKATARMGDRTVEAYGSAHVDRGDDHFLLLEMSDTRARKRALSIITGAGAVAVSELKTEPEGGQ